MDSFSIILSISRKIPLTYQNMLVRAIGRKEKTILDVGCGKGGIMMLINKDKKFRTIGVDLSQEYLDECNRNGTHDLLIRCDINRLPFKDKSIDVVLCCEVIEHLDKESGFSLLDAMEKIASNKVVVTTPYGFKEEEDEEFQRHKSGWYPNDFSSKGYTVRGQGTKLLTNIIYSKKGVRTTSANSQSGTSSHFRQTLILVLLFLLRPFAYFSPQYSFHLFCTKEIKSSN